MMYTFLVIGSDGYRISEYGIYAKSLQKAWETVKQYTAEDGFNNPSISLIK